MAISILTPSQSGGGPGQIYMLTRRGRVGVGAGLTATLISFMGTIVGLLLMGVYSVLVSGIGASGPLLLAPVWALTVIATVLLLGAIWPDLFRIALGALSRAVWRMLAPARGGRSTGGRPSTPRVGPAVDRMDRRDGLAGGPPLHVPRGRPALPPPRQGVRRRPSVSSAWPSSSRER